MSNWIASYVRPASSQASMVTGDSHPVTMAKSAVYTLHEYVRDGVPGCYADLPWGCDAFRETGNGGRRVRTPAAFEDSLVDWWSDLPWDEDGMEEARAWMLQDPDSLAVFESVRVAFGFDMKGSIESFGSE